MLRWARKIGYGAATILLIIGIVVHAPVSAASGCSASVDLHSVPPTSFNQYTITVTNTGSTALDSIDITVPSSNFTYAGNSINGWSTADHSGGTTLSGNSLGSGQTATFAIAASTDVATAASANWQVHVSDGSGNTSCGGDLGTAISGHPPNDSANGVSDITVSGITASTATITWTTDNPMGSLVYYGRTSDYGSSSVYDATPATTHSMTLTGLSADSGYHFQVAGSDGQGNFAYSADSTFLTAAKPVVTIPTPTTPHSVVVGKGATGDSIPPQVSLSTKLAGAYKTVPTLTGVASDDKAIAQVDYSTDGGKNWLPVDSLKTAGQPKVSFTFTPLLPADGNYVVVVRAMDTGGNTTTTAAQTLVIDRLPPLVGGNVFSVGPQVMQPGSDGTIKAIVGVDQKITLSAVGGPTNISLVANTTVKTKTGTKPYTQNFSLTASEDTGLWSGVMSFTRAGVYSLTVNALDGAGNKTSRTLNGVAVSSPGHTFDATTHKAVASTVTLYYLEPESHTWVVWDGAAFGQNNPQKATTSGTFSMFLPPGTYYLKAAAAGYHTLVSSIFTASQPTPLVSDLNLSPMGGLRLGSHHLSLPTFSVQHIDLATHQVSKNNDQNSLIGSQAPDFSLSDTTGATIHTADLLGRPTLLSFNTTWSPTTAEQLASLSALQANADLNVIPVALQENSGRVQAYTDIANVSLRWLVDPDSTLGSRYSVQSLPTHYFIDRKGVIRQVVVGVLSQQQMLSNLTEL